MGNTNGLADLAPNLPLDKAKGFCAEIHRAEMRLYAGTSKNFIEDTVRNQIAEKLRRAKTRTKKILIKDLVLMSFLREPIIGKINQLGRIKQ